jgi:hypothetical protein
MSSTLSQMMSSAHARHLAWLAPLARRSAAMSSTLSQMMS